MKAFADIKMNVAQKCEICFFFFEWEEKKLKKSNNFSFFFNVLESFFVLGHSKLVFFDHVF